LFVHDALARLAVAVSDQVQKVMAVMVALVALGAIPVRAADIANTCSNTCLPRRHSVKTRLSVDWL